jgi:hypothetical protein
MAIAKNHSYTGNKIREDFHDVIYDISPTDTPLLTMAKRLKAKNTLHQWTYDALTPPGANAALEGGDYSITARAQPTTLGNYTQILVKTASVSGTFEAVDKVGRKSEMARQVARMSKEIKRDLEYALVRNQASENGSAATARTMASLESWIATSGVGNGVKATGSSGGTTVGYSGGTVAAPAATVTAKAFGEANLKTALGYAWTDGGDPSVIMMSSKNKEKFSGFTGIATRFNDVRGATEANIISAADIYVSDYGVHKAVMNRYMRDEAVLCIDPEYVGVAFLRGFQTKDIPAARDGTEKAILCEATLVVQNPLAHAKVCNTGG